MIKFKPIALMLALGAFYCQGAFASQVTLYGKIDEGLLVESSCSRHSPR